MIVAPPPPLPPVVPPPPALPPAFRENVLVLFRGTLSIRQEDGLRRIFWGSTSFSAEDRAYILATVFHETARVMAPIEEYGRGAGKPYPPYYGRGLPQLTWKYNYARFGTLLGVDLVGHPERALDWDVALPVLLIGMRDGLFTGRKLAHYFGPASYGCLCNPIDARRIINGTDRAELVAGYFRVFLAAIQNSAPPAAPLIRNA